jgi:hypothetical protein
MRDWRDGYVEGLRYVHTYQPELNPLRVAPAFLHAGLVAPAIHTACELGFGLGVSANLHAASSATTWYGTDFDAGHAGFARELCAASGAPARFFDQSFEEFCQRTDLPEFDFIGLHGVWSWINDRNRAVIVDFLRRKLKVGGVAYVGYNAQPGWAAMICLRDLLIAHVESQGSAARGMQYVIDAALDFAEQLLAAEPAFREAHPGIQDQLIALKGEDRRYLAHEYFNRDWAPMSFHRVTDMLSGAKLEYACSANHCDAVGVRNLKPEQQALIKASPAGFLRETALDFMVNRKFRRDYWVKGARRITPLEKIDGFRSQRVMLMRTRADVSLRPKIAGFEFVLNPEICDPILDALGDHRPRTLGQIEAAVKDRGINFFQVVDLALTLADTGELASVQDDALTRAARKQTDKLNAYVLAKARHSAEYGLLASPVTGGGMADVDRLVQYFLSAIQHGMKQPAELAAHALPLCRAASTPILKDGAPLESHEEATGELTSRARVFLDKQLPIFKALQIV